MNPGVYDITHAETEWSVDEDGNEGPPRTVRVLWKNARVLMNDGGDLIIQHDTGIRGTWPRIDRVMARYLSEYEFVPVSIEDGA